MAADGRTFGFQDGKYDPFYPMLAVSLALHLAALVGLTVYAKYWSHPSSIRLHQENYVVHFVDPGETPGTPGTGKSAIVETAPPPSEQAAKPSAPVEKKLIPVTKGEAREIKKVAAVKKKIAEEKSSASRETREVKKLKVHTDAPRKKAEAVGKEVRERKGGGAVDIKKFPYDWYLGQMESKVFGNWDALQANMSAIKSTKVVVLFSIDRRGKLVKSEIEESSFDQNIDKSALEAVVKSAPFPPLPDGYAEDTLDVHFGFNISPK